MYNIIKITQMPLQQYRTGFITRTIYAKFIVVCVFVSKISRTIHCIGRYTCVSLCAQLRMNPLYRMIYRTHSHKTIRFIVHLANCLV